MLQLPATFTSEYMGKSQKHKRSSNIQATVSSHLARQARTEHVLQTPNQTLFTSA